MIWALFVGCFMRIKFIDYINRLKTKRKLQKEHPDAEIFTLDTLFPNTFENDESMGKKMIAIKRGSGSVPGFKKVYEKKHSAMGTIETNIIPIEYHSLYSYGIGCEVIKDAFEKYPDFFRTFLDDYSKVVIDDTHDATDDELVIDNYTSNLPVDGYQLEDFIKAALKKYNISIEDAVRLAGRLNDFKAHRRKRKAFNFKDFLRTRNFSVDDLVYYYVANGKFDEAKYVLDHPYHKIQVRDRFIANEAIAFLDETLDSNIFSPIVEKNANLVSDAVNSLMNIVNNRDSYRETTPTIRLSRVDAIKMTKVLLGDIDPTGNLLNYFTKALKDGKILTFDFDSKTGLSYSFFRENDNGEIAVFQERVLDDSANFIAIDCTDSIVDVINLVGKVAASYLRNSYLDYEEARDYLGTMIVSFYETKACDWLIDKGYDEESIKQIQNKKRAHEFTCDSLEVTQNIVNVLAKKKDYGDLSMDVISDDKKSEDRQKFAVTTAFNLFDSRGSLNDEFIAYALGCHFGDTYKDEDFSTAMMWVADNYSNLDISNDSLFSTLMKSTNEEFLRDEEIGPDPAISWIEGMQDFPCDSEEIGSIEWGDIAAGEHKQYKKGYISPAAKKE